ncbi:MAG: eL32 family ribosomal protein [Candidatus Pacearchaeota archaeon]
MVKKFLRRNTTQYLRLGKKRKKLQKWRRPRGRHNKMRERRAGYPSVVSIGYRKNKNERGKINGDEVIFVRNLEEMKKLENKKVILGKVGMKKKIQLIKLAKERNIKILNIDSEILLEENKDKKEMNKGEKR